MKTVLVQFSKSFVGFAVIKTKKEKMKVEVKLKSQNRSSSDIHLEIKLEHKRVTVLRPVYVKRSKNGFPVIGGESMLKR